ncbi:formylglycine-generating enzyme family protein [Endothiovibrio diazotrophicus]
MAIFTPAGAARVPVKGRIAAAEALGKAGDPRLVEGVEGLWVPLDGATFTLGAQRENREAANYDPDAGNNETPRRITVAPFRLARRPVTVAEFARFIDDGGCRDRRWWREDRLGEEESPKEWDEQAYYFPNHPVTGASWFEANAYCAWLTERRRRLGEIDAGERIRLPREEEWEWAARGAGLRCYPWGDQEATEGRLNFGREVARPTPVGIYPGGHTPEDLEDMAGNVWEWCVNEYRAPERTGTEGNAPRVLRGGSWLSHRRGTRCEARNGLFPFNRLGDVGFRVLWSPPSPRRRETLATESSVPPSSLPRRVGRVSAA